MLKDLDRAVKEGRISAGVALAVLHEQSMADLGLAAGFCPHCGACTHDGCVAAERERCAKIVENFAAACPGPTGPDIRTLVDAAVIADKIREGSC